MAARTPARIAVLGGGMAALAAAASLTDPRRAPANAVQVTVYQLGWRLGGKGASGRSLDAASYGRIEEHGLHNLFGFYDHTFALMRGAHAELRERWAIDRGEFMHAVAPESAAVFVEEIGGRVRPWHIHNPTNTHVPGDAGPLPLACVLRMSLEFLALNVRDHARARDAAPPSAGIGALARSLESLLAPLESLLRDDAAPERAWWESLARVLARVPSGPMITTLELARRSLYTLLRRRFDDDGPRRLWIVAHFVSAVLLGLVRDRVFERGLESINHLDFRAWLRPHMLDDAGLLERSPLMRVVYDSSFAYRGGDTRLDRDGVAPAADYEAGTFLAGLLRANFTYKGAFGWKLVGGTGDVLIAPLYELLRARGVEFRFFHRVDALQPDAEARAVERIVLTEQARPRAGLDHYAPLVEFGDRPCWPNRPLWEQLEQGEALAALGLDLEDPRVEPAGARRVELERGRDFDHVVLGISFAALPGIASALIHADPRWQRAVQHVQTTRTQALQVWLRKGAPTPGHGGEARRGQPITGFWYDDRSPLNVWADMSHLLAHEGWPGGEQPGHLSYYVSPLADDAPDDDASAQVRAHACRVLDGAAAQQLREPGSAGFQWDQLIDRRDAPGQGSDRLDAQYWRANTHASERYVLSVAGSTAHRLAPHERDGFANLFLAGDWTRNGMNCGAMESAVIGGELAAAALLDTLEEHPQ